MSYDYRGGFGHIFTYDGYRLGVNTIDKMIFHFGKGF